MKTKKVLYIVPNIFSHHIAHTFLPQSFVFHHFTTYIYPSHYTPLSPHSLLFISLPFPSLHFYTLFNVFLFVTLNWNECCCLRYKEDKLQCTAVNCIVLSVCESESVCGCVSVCGWVGVWVSVSVYACVCVRERERESVYVCVCMCECVCVCVHY